VLGRVLCLAATILSLNAFSVATAKSSLKPEKAIQIGEKRSIGKQRIKEASLYIFWNEDKQNLMRDPALDASISTIEQGAFPVSGSLPQEHILTVYLTIDENGLPKACGIIEPSEAVSINAHICPHLLEYARFYPALDQRGVPSAVSGNFYVSYKIQISGKGITPPPVYVVAADNPNKREASPIYEIKKENIGITPESIASKKLTQIGISLGIDKDGIVGTCHFNTPTFDDALDRLICERASQLKFVSALDSNDQPTNGMYYITLQFDKE
jgi:hypothetical protein